MRDTKDADLIWERRYLQMWLNQLSLIHSYLRRSVCDAELKECLERSIADFMMMENMQGHWEKYGQFYPTSFQKMVNDCVIMLEYSVYSVISPEGCASILWKSAEKAETAAEAMGITAPRLRELGLIDEVVREPLGGAHRDAAGTAELVRKALVTHLRDLEALDINELRRRRSARLRSYGSYREN